MNATSPITLNFVRHTVAVVVARPVRGVALEECLTKAGFQTVICSSLSQVKAAIDRDMPHAIVTDSVVCDGNAGTLYDQLQANTILRAVPVIVIIQKKTKEEVAPIVGRRFAAVFLGQFEPMSLVKKLREALVGLGAVSPFFMAAPRDRLPAEAVLELNAVVLGRLDDRVIIRAALPVDPSGSFLAVPAAGDREPAVLRLGTSLKGSGGDLFNAFPLIRIVGKGRRWLADLPEMNLQSDEGRRQGRWVAFFDPNVERGEKFGELLKGYDMDVYAVKSLREARRYLEHPPRALGGCFFLFELTSDAASIEWRTAVAKLPPAARPPMVVGTSSVRAPETDAQVRYLKRPFGLGQLVEALEAGFARADQITQWQRTGSGAKGIAISLRLPAKLVGVDEQGGVAEVRLALRVGDDLLLVNEFFHGLQGGTTTIKITAVAQVPEVPDTWLVHFTALPPGVSKRRYWTNVLRRLS